MTAQSTVERRRRLLRRPLALASAAVLATGMVVASGSAASGAPGPLGSSSEYAAASCWEIKQKHPSSADGVYWLYTPAMPAPERFYCDMTTDGGGWVLIGRGRQGWDMLHEGQGWWSQLRTNISGPSAFTPGALSGDVINGLLNGTAVKDLDDGVRLRRAKNSAGTDWQEVRLKFANLKEWSWAFDAGTPGTHKLTGGSFDGKTFTGGDTRDLRGSRFNSHERLLTYRSRESQWKSGFGYGPISGGSTGSQDHLWRSSGGLVIPFTQVFIRPKITNVKFQSIPDGGTPAEANPPLMSNTTTPLPWGVTGVVGNGTGEQNLEVQSMAVMNNTLYVGGKFEFVQKGRGGEKIRQSFLAAFDTRTGEWKSGFRPTLDDQVWSIVAAGGKVVIGGEFTNVDGVANTNGLAALDPVTGEVLEDWKADVTASDGGKTMIRALDVQDGYVYAGGSFTRVRDRTNPSSVVKVGRTARFRLSDGKVDPQWKPHFGWTIMDLDVSEQGDRVYYGGHFTDAVGEPARKLAVISTERPGKRVSGLKDQQWTPSVSNVQKQYRQLVEETGNRVWIGGSEHDLQSYSRPTFDKLTGNITKPGGDFQAIAEINGIVYATCHCNGFVYNGASTWPDPGDDWTNAHRIKYIGAWEASSGKYLPNFYPRMNARVGAGPWEVVEDNAGCMWFGGDLNEGSWGQDGPQWLGGFGKLCPTDSTPPTTPSGFWGTKTEDGIRLSWSAATDNAGSVKYEVLRDDRVIAVGGARNYTDTTAGAGEHRYFVRAVDESGNRGKSTPVLVR